MSARDRLIEAMGDGIWASLTDPAVSSATGIALEDASRRAIASFLSSPDDLLAVLVEAGVLDRAEHHGGTCPSRFCYRRTQEERA